MSRLKRFEDHRFIGDRWTMKVYDCDDEDQFRALQALILERGFHSGNRIQSFAPDELSEALNRSFRPVQ